jgi:hypothetical protein
MLKKFLIRFVLTLVVILGSCQSSQAPFPWATSSSDPAVSPQENSFHLVPLAQPGPWSGIAHFIGYGDRLWFVNSVTGGDYNTADLYSYDPANGTTRYEGHLFSQDAGIPTVSQGLLYWPFEDPRLSTNGEYAVTNGKDWQWHYIPEGEIFHTHVMVDYQGALFVGTGAWSGELLRSNDRGLTWQLLYQHPTPSGNVSRITDLKTFRDKLYGGLTALRDPGAKLLEWTGETFNPVQGWPEGKMVEGLTPHQDWLYAINKNPDNTTTVWRTNGQKAEAVSIDPHYQIRALASSSQFLWAVGVDSANGGVLWHSANGLEWQVAQQFAETRPIALTVYGDQVYVGTWQQNGKGTLWGEPSPATVEPALPVTPLPTGTDPLTADEQAVALENLDRLLRDPFTYQQDPIYRLITALYPLTQAHSPTVGKALVERLQTPFPQIQASLFGGHAFESAEKVARCYLLWAIGLNGYGRVPLDLLAEPWTQQENSIQKYWNVPAVAAWTVAQVHQDDRETLQALVDRFQQTTDPLWLRGDFVGALVALTGEQWGYDGVAWQNWLNQSKS